jgi:hypothetical protein
MKYYLTAICLSFAVLSAFAETNAVPRPTVAQRQAEALKAKYGMETVSFQLPAASVEALDKIVHGRDVIESREIVDGKVVERWRKGHRTWVSTNAVTPVVGAVLSNTFRERIAELREERDENLRRLAQAISQATSAEARAARAEARFNSATNNLQKAIDDAKLPTTKLLLQGILDALLKAVDD